jgi:aldehyde dehydrogenase (NAD+)
VELTRNYIGGKWVESVTGESFTSTNPATGETVGVVTRSGRADVQLAVEAAREAFPAWRRLPAPVRGEILLNAGRRLQEKKEELARLITAEMGKVLPEARGDVQEAIDIALYMAGEGRRLFGQTTPSELADKFCLTVRQPLGVVAAITPWNFPVAIPAWKVMPALIAGNTVVLKPSSETPVCAAAFVRALEEAGVPAGVVNLVLGPGGPAGEALVAHPAVAAVTFTGSTETGIRLAAAAAAANKKISLEMGGKNAIIVMDDADLDLAADGIIWSAYGTSGQRCTACSRVIVHAAVKDVLLGKLLVRIEKLRLGNGLEAGVDLGPVINREQLAKIDGHVREAAREGARLVAGGAIAAEGELAKGNFYRPTLFTEVTPEMRIAREEIFGPVLAVITVRSLEEAIAVNNGTGYGLSSAIYTASVENAFRAMQEITTGIVYVNAGTIGAEVHLPFGGTRGSGNGHREVGTACLEFYTEWKALYVDFSGRLQRAQIDNR